MSAYFLCLILAGSLKCVVVGEYQTYVACNGAIYHYKKDDNIAQKGVYDFKFKDGQRAKLVCQARA